MSNLVNCAAILANVGSGCIILVSLPDSRRVDEVGIDFRFHLSRSSKMAATQRADSTDGMQHARLSSRASDPLPPRFVDRLAVFVDLFPRPTSAHAPVPRAC